MVKVKFSDRELLYVPISKADLKDSKQAECYYTAYNDQFIDDLFRLQTKQNFAHIIVLFDKDKVKTVLRHINVYDFFTYTLVPSEINEKVYKEIYEFFVTSNMSVSYITLFGSLILSPKIIADSVQLNEQVLKLNPCKNCPLMQRKCSKIVPFLNLYHPERVPQKNDIKDFCKILIKLSLDIYRDFSNTVELLNFEAFKRTRDFLGVKSHFWIDPFKIYC